MEGVCAFCVSDDQCRGGVCSDGRCLPLCGNGTIDGTEQCDDGNRVDGDDCTSDCLLGVARPCSVSDQCGTGLCRGNVCVSCNKNEECGDDKLCIRRACVPAPVCGNGEKELGEQCDDGNADDGDDCSNRCRLGNGNVCTDNRQCESNRCPDGFCRPCDSNDQCASGECRDGKCTDLCGNGALDSGEECDEGAANSDVLVDRCRTDCRRAYCGDGISDAAEQCDDGNAVAGDGCDRYCRLQVRAVQIDLTPSVNDIARSRPPAGQTGPGAVAAVAIGAAAGWAAMRRRFRK